MSRDIAGHELGFEILPENGNRGDGVMHLIASGAPAGGGLQDDANIGSKVYDYANGRTYVKKLAGAGADRWVKEVELTDLNSVAWRSKVKVVTADNVTSGAARDLVASPLSDDDGTTLVAADFALNDLAIVDINATPRLVKVTAIAGDSVTFTNEANALVANDNFICRYYLPDPDGQENQAWVHYNGTGIIKVGDIDWKYLSAISLSAGYTAVNGTILANDDGETAISKLDGNQQDIQTSLGIAQGDVNFGTFTGSIISDNQTAKQIFQELETYIASLITEGENLAVTAAVVLDQVLVDEYQKCIWEVAANDNTDPTKVKQFTVKGIHNGHAAADATAAKDQLLDVQQLGGNFSTTVTVELAGTGAAQYMQLKVAAAAAASFRFFRQGVKF